MTSDSNLKTPSYERFSSAWTQTGAQGGIIIQSLTVGGGAVLCLAIEPDVPDIRSGILRLSGLVGVDESLSRGRMRANQRHGVTGVETHVNKPIKQDRDRAFHIRDKPLWCSVLCLRSANPRLDRRSAYKVAVSEMSEATTRIRRGGGIIPGQTITPRIPATWRRSPLETPNRLGRGLSSLTIFWRPLFSVLRTSLGSLSMDPSAPPFFSPNLSLRME